MSFLERARERAVAATEQVRMAAEHAGTRTTGAQEPHAASSEDAVLRAKDAGDLAEIGRGGVRHGLDSARAGLAMLVDRLDPALVADVVIKATTVQERANAALHEKGSAYRIDGISITATIPPQISFSISRSAAGED